MAVLDLNYVSDLVRKSQTGDSDAFAEFFAATYPQQYAFAKAYLEDEKDAQHILAETYTRALREIPRLADPSIVLAWLNQICMVCCLKLRGAFDGANIVLPGGSKHTLTQVLTLPVTQAQALLLSQLCDLRLNDIATLLGVTKADVRGYVREGSNRLTRFDKNETAQKGGSRA